MLIKKYILVVPSAVLLFGVVSAFGFGKAPQKEQPVPAPAASPVKSDCAQYMLDQARAIADPAQRPQGAWQNMRSPHDNSELELIILDPDDPNVADESWRFAYYSKTEDIFWIADMPGEKMTWYGPFEGKPCEEK